MGKYNSSLYRVRPLMDVVKKDYQLFIEILKLVEIEELSLPQSYWYDGERCQEKQLKPSKDHLTKLIDYISKKEFQNTDNIKNKYRKRLCIPDIENVDSRKEARNLAIAELNKSYDNMDPSCKAWYVFEGFTSPDIFIEGDDYVIVCEGKWTEPYITEQTTNLKKRDGEYRNQMIRHIQGALNYTTKKVYAFYIADKECSYLKELEKEKINEHLKKETIELDDLEKGKIRGAFRGYTTWQDIEAVASGIKFKTKEEIIEQRRKYND